MPENMKHCHGCCVLWQMFAGMLCAWMREGMTEIAMMTVPRVSTSSDSTSPEDEKTEVNSFIGYAIKSHFQSLCAQARCGDDEDEKLEAKIKWVKTMRTFHNQAIHDEECVKNYYSNTHHLHNNGFLTLVSKQCWDFGKKLMSEIRTGFDSSAIEV